MIQRVVMGGSLQAAEAVAHTLSARLTVVGSSPRPAQAFLDRLRWFLRAEYAPYNCVLLDSAPRVILHPLNSVELPAHLPKPYTRMLERLVLGTGTAVLGPDYPLWVGGLPRVMLQESTLERLVGQHPPNRAGLGANPGPGVVALVGERCGPGWSARPQWPFISALQTGCSAWLCDLLEHAGVPERRLYWINALDSRGAPRPRAEADPLRAAQGVVALGNVAAEWCDLHGLRHAKVYHPAYWKRFHGRSKYVLPETVLKLLSTQS